MIQVKRPDDYQSAPSPFNAPSMNRNGLLICQLRGPTTYSRKITAALKLWGPDLTGREE